ncbi:class I SAM-dependent methyltransferase [Nonlabens sp.]|uniref:class I SAM-dependent methyltransferase n=1 Tax=Nonlabens sp. TaxID=1888209 RepID=UPI0025FDD14E|nr:class I SAM-dependent methyltransferase [Nonlabens sp.]
MNKNSKKQLIKKPWPTKAAMEQIYDKGLWGTTSGAAYYSGEGSHHPDIVVPYINAVSLFLNSFEDPISLCDLGCGDFNIGKELVPFTKSYTAIDIASNVITQNKKKFQKENLKFLCLDIAVDPLPAADCALLRQVLQHLSNSEIQSILDQLRVYKYVILTEHLPEADFVPNKDIISGQGIRLKKQSGLNVLVAPFHFSVKEAKQLLFTRLDKGKGVLVTTLYKVY